MASSAQFSVSSTPTVIASGKKDVWVACNDFARLGGSNVSTSNGMILRGDVAPIKITLNQGEDLYAIANTGTVQIYVLDAGN